MAVGVLNTNYSASLLALWHLDGNSTDSGVNAHNGTDTVVTYPLAKFSRGALFDGVSSRIATAANIGISGTGARTLMGWVRTTVANDAYLISTSANGANASMFVRIHNNVIIFDTQDASVDGVKNVNDGLWHHFAATTSGTTVNIYVDGALDATGTLASMNTTDDTLDLGAAQGATGYLTGYLDEVAIYGRTWTAKEIRDYYMWASGKGSKIL